MATTRENMQKNNETLSKVGKKVRRSQARTCTIIVAMHYAKGVQEKHQGTRRKTKQKGTRQEGVQERQLGTGEESIQKIQQGTWQECREEMQPGTKL